MRVRDTSVSMTLVCLCDTNTVHKEDKKLHARQAAHTTHHSTQHTHPHYTPHHRGKLTHTHPPSGSTSYSSFSSTKQKRTHPGPRTRTTCALIGFAFTDTDRRIARRDGWQSRRDTGRGSKEPTMTLVNTHMVCPGVCQGVCSCVCASQCVCARVCVLMCV